MRLTAPTGARSVKILDRKRFVNTPIPLPAKDPLEILNYALDFSGVMESSSRIVGVDICLQSCSDQLYVVAWEIQEQLLVFVLDSGAVYTVEKFTITCAMSDGEAFIQTLLLPIVEKIKPLPSPLMRNGEPFFLPYCEEPAPPALLTRNGRPLVLPGGIIPPLPGVQKGV